MVADTVEKRKSEMEEICEKISQDIIYIQKKKKNVK
jgi:hypothetical protein